MYYFHNEHGNVMGLVDENNGDTATHYESDPYGSVTAASAIHANVNLFHFSAKYLDSETGLYYYGYRYYQPSTGRWISEDPMREQGGLNLYAFVGNDSLDGIDPYGECCCVCLKSFQKPILPLGQSPMPLKGKMLNEVTYQTGHTFSITVNLTIVNVPDNNTTDTFPILRWDEYSDQEIAGGKNKWVDQLVNAPSNPMFTDWLARKAKPTTNNDCNKNTTSVSPVTLEDRPALYDWTFRRPPGAQVGQWTRNLWIHVQFRNSQPCAKACKDAGAAEGGDLKVWQKLSYKQVASRVDVVGTFNWWPPNPDGTAPKLPEPDYMAK